MGELLTPEHIVYGLRTAGDPQISPDGSKVVFTLSQANQDTGKTETQIWLCDRDGADQRQMTQSGKSNNSPRWSPDGSQVAFISDRVESDRKGSRGIFLMDLDGGEAREITRHAQGVQALAWSLDGKHLTYTTAVDPDNPDEEPEPENAPRRVRVTRRIDYKQDGQGFLGDVRQQVFIVDAASRERRQLTKGSSDSIQPQWAPDGGTVAAMRPSLNGMNAQLALIDVATGSETMVGPDTGVISSWAWSPNGDRIVFTGDTKQTWQSDFFVYETMTGGIRRITEDLECQPAGSAAQPVWLDDNNVLFNATRAGAGGLYVIDLSVGEVEKIEGGQFTAAGLSADDEQRYVARSYASLEQTGEICIYDREDDSFKVITGFNDDFFKEQPAAEWERFEIERGGYTIESWLLKPRDFDETKQYPLVLTVHGGPNGNYGYAWEPVQQMLAANGFLVAFSNPRGSTSYGREFTLQVSEDWGGEDFQDLMVVVDHVLERPYADPDRTAIEGYSYGGYMTAWTIGQTERFKAAVCGAPCFDLPSMYGTSDISHSFGELQWGGGPNEAPEWYRDHSPSTYAHRATTPTLIIQGEADERCPIGQGEQMFVALLKAGCEVEFARYPGGAHGFRRMGPPPHRQDMFERTLCWMQEKLG